MNPPYSEDHIELFIQKAFYEAAIGNAATLSIFPAKKSEQTWYHRLVIGKSSVIIPVEKRISFLRDGVPMTSPNHASVMVAWVPGYLYGCPITASFHAKDGGIFRTCPLALKNMPNVDGSWRTL